DNTVIEVAEAFTPADLEALQEAAQEDPRLGWAGRTAEDGRVAQQLAGVRELMGRYRTAPPAARALIDAAMDARRLGAAHLPVAFLEHAAPGYLTSYEWDQLDEDWLDQALG